MIEERLLQEITRLEKRVNALERVQFSGPLIALVLDQGTADDEILSLRSSDVAHGMTAITTTKTFGFAQKNAAANGGLMIEGLSEGTAGGLKLRGTMSTAVTAKSTAASAAVVIEGYKKNGTGRDALAANENILVVRTGTTNVALIDADGDAHFSGGLSVGDITASPAAVGDVLAQNDVIGKNCLMAGSDATTLAGWVRAAHTRTLTAAVADGHAASYLGAPTYSGAWTVTRHNYSYLANPVLAGGAAVTDACVIRYDAAPGTHKALDSGTTKTTPRTVNAWRKDNVNGTIYYTPMYTSKTS